MATFRDNPGAVIRFQLPSRWFYLNEVNADKGEDCGHPTSTYSDFCQFLLDKNLERATSVDLWELMTVVPHHQLLNDSSHLI